METDVSIEHPHRSLKQSLCFCCRSERRTIWEDSNLQHRITYVVCWTMPVTDQCIVGLNTWFSVFDFSVFDLSVVGSSVTGLLIERYTLLSIFVFIESLLLLFWLCFASFDRKCSGALESRRLGNIGFPPFDEPPDCMCGLHVPVECSRWSILKFRTNMATTFWIEI